MIRRAPGLGILLAVLACSTSTPTTAQDATSIPFRDDGWYRWQFDAVATTAELCCHVWHNQRPVPTACDLDRDGLSYGHFSDGEVDGSGRAKATGEHQPMSLFARVENGVITRLQPVSPSCEVRTDRPWTDLGRVSNADSLAWLQKADETTMAIALHAGAEARNELVHMARSGRDRKTRQDAIFWMGQLRIADTRDELIDLIEHGDSEGIREQAIFSYAQSPAEDRTRVLIHIVEDTRRDMHDRKKALFWLAQADEGDGIDYIQALLTQR